MGRDAGSLRRRSVVLPDRRIAFKCQREARVALFLDVRSFAHIGAYGRSIAVFGRSQNSLAGAQSVLFMPTARENCVTADDGGVPRRNIPIRYAISNLAYRIGSPNLRA